MSGRTRTSAGTRAGAGAGTRAATGTRAGAGAGARSGSRADADVEVDVEGRRLKLSNLDKVLYPEPGFRKAEVIEYYRAIAPVLLPHLRRRPLTLKRYPGGVRAEFFYEKRCPASRPSWVHVAKVWSERQEEELNFCTVDDLPSLVWVANLASLELHVSLGRAPHIDRPDAVVFDLDPGPPADIVSCCRVALLLRRRLDELGLQALAKTSGSKGLQVYVPLNRAITYQRTKAFAHALALELEREHAGLVVSRMPKDLREGKVFVDWSQNDEHKTTVSVYSLRARERPTVSTPVSWQEVEKGAKGAKLVFEAEEVLKRVEKMGDLFAGALSLKQKLPVVGGED